MLYSLNTHAPAPIPSSTLSSLKQTYKLHMHAMITPVRGCMPCQSRNYQRSIWPPFLWNHHQLVSIFQALYTRIKVHICHHASMIHACAHAQGAQSCTVRIWLFSNLIQVREGDYLQVLPNQVWVSIINGTYNITIAARATAGCDVFCTV